MTMLGDTMTSSRGFALGTYAMSGSYGDVDETQALGTIDHFIDSGGEVLDTADLYGNGHNERLVGKAIKGKRDSVLLCSKFGFVYGKSMEERLLDGRPDRVRQACEESLARLGTDHIDLYYLHRVDPNVPVEETVGAMGSLVSAGLISHIGLCEVGKALYQRAKAVVPVHAIQSEYSLLAREPESMLEELEQDGARLCGYSALARGFLTGEIRSPDAFPKGDQRRELPRYQGNNFVHNLKLVDRLAEIAKELDLSTPSLAIAWCLRHGKTFLPVIGATQLSHVDDAFAAFEPTLPSEVVEELSTIFAPENIAGERYPGRAMERIRATSM